MVVTQRVKKCEEGVCRQAGRHWGGRDRGREANGVSVRVVSGSDTLIRSDVWFCCTRSLPPLLQPLVTFNSFVCLLVHSLVYVCFMTQPKSYLLKLLVYHCLPVIISRIRMVFEMDNSTSNLSYSHRLAKILFSTFALSSDLYIYCCPHLALTIISSCTVPNQQLYEWSVNYIILLIIAHFSTGIRSFT